MQIVFLRAVIADNPVRPVSSTQAYSQTIQVAMALQPCVGKSPLLPCREMAEVLALTDVRDQIRYLRFLLTANDIPAMNPEPMLPIPLRFLSKNAGVYEN